MILSKLTDYLKIDHSEFLFQFQSHPDYPSALAFSDTLDFLGVKNDAYNLEKEFWEDLPEEFITIYNQNFALATRNKSDDYTVFSDKEEKIPKAEFLENTQNFVLLFEKENPAKEKSKLNFSYFVYAVFGVILLYSFILLNWQSIIYNSLSILGVYVSLEIFRLHL